MLYLSLILTFFTGTAALIYEVAWHRYIYNLIGTESYASALILTVFLAGLGIGYLGFGSLAKKLSSKKNSSQILISLTGVLEIAIGVWGVIFLLIYQLFWQSTGVVASSGAVADLSLIALFILIPTILMGGTLPLLTQGLYTGGMKAGKLHALIYATNTFGAFFGCLIAGFVILPNLGIDQAIKIALSINILAGIIFIALAKNSKLIPISDEPEILESKGELSVTAGLSIAVIAGFYSLAFQSIFIRLAGLTVGASEYAFPIIVGVFILSIALGSSFLVGREKPINLFKNQLVIFVSLAVLYFTISFWPYFFHILRTAFSLEVGDFFKYYLAVFFAFFTFLIIPIGAIGATLPLLFTNLKSKPEEFGLLVGKIYGINVVGTVFGCLVGGYYLLYLLNLPGIFILALACVALTMVILGKQKIKIAILTSLVLGLCIIFSWPARYIGIGLFHEKKADEFSYSGRAKFYDSILGETKVLAYKDGPNTSVTILEFPADSVEGTVDSRSVLVNGKSDGNTEGDEFTMKYLAHLPASLTGDSSSKAAVIGFGTGMTSGVLSLYPNISEIQNIEISPIVNSFANYFDAFNDDTTHDKKNKFITADAYRYLGTTDDEYAVIVSGLSNFWMSGVDRLFSTEFYDIVKSRLAKDGVFIQWISLWGLSPDTVKSAVNTISNSFPNIRFFNTGYSLFAVATFEPIGTENIQNVINRFAVPEVKQDLAKLNIFSPEVLMSLEKPLAAENFSNYEINTLAHTSLGYKAGVDFFTDSATDFPTLQIGMKTTELTKLVENSLLAIDGKEHTLPNLTQILQASCGGAKIQLVEPEWRTQRSLCRDAAIALMLKQEVPPPAHLELEIQKVRDLFLSDEPIVPLAQENIAVANRYLRYYEHYNTIFLPLSIKKLKWKLSVCYARDLPENLACQKRLNALL